jgi:hypothetical protein
LQKQRQTNERNNRIIGLTTHEAKTNKQPTDRPFLIHIILSSPFTYDLHYSNELKYCSVMGETMNNMDDDFDPFGLKQEVKPLPGDPDGFHVDSSQFDPFGIRLDLKKSDDLEASNNNIPIDQKNDTANALDVRSLDSPIAPPIVSRVTRKQPSSPTKGGVSAIILPPKLNVKLTIHEDVTSFAQANKEGASDVTVEGRICAQVQCSDANRNAPFCLEAADGHSKTLVIRSTTSFASENDITKTGHSNFFNIPKHEIGFVPIATYTMSDCVQHMPLLLERKVTVNDTYCRVAIQVRSKLTNNGDIGQFVIALAVPELVEPQSVQIERGDGAWDELKRTVKWNRAYLKRGESFMVSIQTTLLHATSKEDLHFPVMLRCSSSSDQISGTNFCVVKADGHAASITLHKTHSFLLLHRLP